MPDPTPPGVPSDAVIEIIKRDPVGSYLLRAAIAEAQVDVLLRQIAERDQQSPQG